MEGVKGKNLSTLNDKQSEKFNTLVKVLKGERYIVGFDELKSAFNPELSDFDLLLLLLELNSTDNLKFLIDENERLIKVTKIHSVSDHEDLEETKQVLDGFKTKLVNILKDS